MDTQKKQLPFPLKHNDLNSCSLCGFPIWMGSCDNCKRLNNKIWNRQVAFARRQPHAVDGRQADKQ